MTEIEHNSYSDGQVHTLTSWGIGGVGKICIGIMRSVTHELPKDQICDRIFKVTSGSVTAKGKKISEGESFRIRAHEKVEISSEELSTFICIQKR